MLKGITGRSVICFTLFACGFGAASSIAQVPEAVYLRPQGPLLSSIYLRVLTVQSVPHR
jgi:hypothetical protein